MMASTSLFPIVAPGDVNDARIAREQLCQWIEMAITLLDAMDGDADFEAETGVDQDIVPITLNPENRMPVKRITMRKATTTGTLSVETRAIPKTAKQLDQSSKI